MGELVVQEDEEEGVAAAVGARLHAVVSSITTTRLAKRSFVSFVRISFVFFQVTDRLSIWPIRQREIDRFIMISSHHKVASSITVTRLAKRNQSWTFYF